MTIVNTSVRGGRIHEGDRQMAKKVGDGRGAARSSGLRKSPRRRAHPKWYRASRDVERCSRVHPLTSAERREEAAGYVYVMQDAVGLTKIGYSDEVGQRLYAMGTAIVAWPATQPIRLVSALVLPRRVARKAELLAHARLWPYRVFERGCTSEWFRVSPHRAGCVVRRAADVAFREAGG